MIGEEYLPSQMWGVIGLICATFMYTVVGWGYLYIKGGKCENHSSGQWNKGDLQVIMVCVFFVGLLILAFSAFHFGAITT